MPLENHAASATKKGKKTSKKNGIYKESQFFAFISPWLIGFFAFTLIPMLYSLYASFTKWNGISAPIFDGLSNYIQMFTSDDRFWTSIINTLVYAVVTVPLNTIIALLMAVLLNKRLPGTNLFRSIFFMPSVIAGVAVYIGWTYLYGSDTGLINYLISLTGVQGPHWLQDPAWAMPALIIMNIFTCGGTMLILLAGLQDISPTYYEAAQLDGANGFQQFFRITFPLLSPILFYITVMQVIGALQIFTQPYVMTQGGPMFSTYTYGLHLYNEAFRYNQFGYSCSLAWVLFIMIMAISILLFGSSKLWVFYREEVD